MPNRLIDSNSPYLLQHAHNPVDWQPWDEQALQLAREQTKPIFLSIGYAACHWCHVMEAESFTDPEIANLLNTHFISIKVDREERPDLDTIYMNAVVSMTGQGGWPMSVFLTPEQQPFYGGTYFPPQPRYGMPSFKQVLLSIVRFWQQEPEEARRLAGSLTEQIANSLDFQIDSSAPGNPEKAAVSEAAQKLIDTYDWNDGGWGAAPRFPAPMSIEFLLQHGMNGSTEALHLLDHMRQGGMYDLVSGGFHRYSTDRYWHIPHFEKMLYDNAQLARVYLHAWIVSGNPAYRRVAQETLDFILSDLSHPAGGFFSSLDADSEGVEGDYYTFSAEEIQSARSTLPARLFEPFGLTGNLDKGGPFLLRYKDQSALQTADDPAAPDLSPLLESLRKIRESKNRPRVDDKIIVLWNALALRAFSEAARYLNEPRYLKAAQQNAAFLLENLVSSPQLYRSWRNGVAAQPAFLEDYAGLAVALFSLYQVDANPRWYQAAVELTRQCVDRFSAPDGGFYESPPAQEDLIAQMKNVQDNVTPSGNALASHAVLLAAQLDVQFPHQPEVLKLFNSLQPLMSRYPSAFAYWLTLSPLVLAPPAQLVIVYTQSNERSGAFLDLARRVFLPGSVSLAAPEPIDAAHAPLLHNRSALNGQPTAYLCQNFVCQLPLTSLAQFSQALQQTGAVIAPAETPAESG
ncbi:MAG: thioredoxin domain-containing protein [Chloroflexi bacterium]|nr:thioredoxin domain-containing protein [Chloroflexota bacterium]